ncbi:MAG: DUF3137 domain-containing protein [Clostridia bacterium]|nr:DUF3137 domain-containing protein [Clostridia bacterium]
MSSNQSAEKYINKYNKVKRFKIITLILAFVALACLITCLVLRISYLGDTFSQGLASVLQVITMVITLDAFAVYIAYIRPAQREFRNEGYGVIISDTVKNAFPGCKYSYKSGNFDAITSTDISSTELIPKSANGFDIYNNIKGVHKSVPFRFCTLEMYNYNIVNSNVRFNNSRIPTERAIKNSMFQGCWFIFDCHIKMDSRVFIVSRQSSSYSDLLYKMKISPLQEILTPDNEFNSMFAVFSYDLESPEYIVTKKIMKNLKYLVNKHHCTALVYCNDGVISVGLNCGRPLLRPDTSIFTSFSVDTVINSAQLDTKFIIDCLNILDFSDYVTAEYTELKKQQNDSMYYTGKDIDTNYRI